MNLLVNLPTDWTVLAMVFFFVSNPENDIYRMLCLTFLTRTTGCTPGIKTSFSR